MKVQNLKLNSKVWLNEKIAKTEKQLEVFVVAIGQLSKKEVEIKVTPDFKNYYTVSANDLDPIPITENVLVNEEFEGRPSLSSIIPELDCDFLKCIHNDSIIVEYNTKKNTLEIRELTNNKLLLYKSDVKYLHQLINLISEVEDSL